MMVMMMLMMMVMMKFPKKHKPSLDLYQHPESISATPYLLTGPARTAPRWWRQFQKPAKDTKNSLPEPCQRRMGGEIHINQNDIVYTLGMQPLIPGKSWQTLAIWIWARSPGPVCNKGLLKENAFPICKFQVKHCSSASTQAAMIFGFEFWILNMFF